MNPVKALESHGQAVWLDFLARGFVAKGELKKLIDTDGVKGVTSNPAIFEKAIGSSDEYDASIAKALKKGDRAVADLFEAVAVEDIQNAADVLRPVYDATNGGDGFVSLEVSPYLANDTKGTIVEAERLWKDVKRKNLMVKVPATEEGLPAIEALTAKGMSINITLLFSQAVYRAGGAKPISRGWKNTSPRAAIPRMSQAWRVSSSAASTAPSTSSSTRRSRRPTIPARKNASPR